MEYHAREESSNELLVNQRDEVDNGLEPQAQFTLLKGHGSAVPLHKNLYGRRKFATKYV
jgi:hypothetical protein